MSKTLLRKPYQRLFQMTSATQRWSGALGTGLLLLASLGAQAQALSGAYTINGAQPTGGTNFATFTEVASRLSISGVAGPVTIAVTGGPYTEQFLLGTIPGVSATNTIVVNGGGSTLQFAPSNTNQRAVVLLNGADYVTLDNLIINATGGTYGFGIQLTSAADNNRITNNTINADLTATSTNFAGIVVSGSATSAVGAGDAGSSNTIEGNTVTGGYYGISVVGSSTTLNQSNAVRNNTVRDFYTYGIYAGYQDGTQIVGNDVARPLRMAVGSFYGVYGTNSSRGLAIEKNRIHDSFSGNATSTGLAYGIYLATGTGATANAPNEVINNVLYNLSGNGTQYVIYSSGAAYSRIYNNSISSDDQASTSTSTTYGIYSSGANADIKNNVVRITRAGTGTKYGLYYLTNAPASNYNALHVPAGNVGYYSTAFATLANWQAANGGAFDQNSVSGDPVFAAPSTGNLLPGNVLLNNAGTPLARVTDDITGAARGAAPDLGAYEFTPVALDLTPVGLAGPAATSACYGTAEALLVQVRNGGTAALDFAANPATVTVVVTPPSGPAQTFTGTLATGTLASAATQNVPLTGTLNLAAPGTYSFAITATVAGDQTPGNDVLAPAVTRTVLAPVAGTVSPAASAVCFSGTVPLTLDGSENGTIQWQQSTDNITFTDIAGATSDTYTTPVLTSTTYFRARTGCNATSVLSNVSTITVNNPQVLTATTPVTGCAGGTATLTATGSAGTTLRYYDAATGGTALGSGPSFTTPTLTASRQYYVEAANVQNSAVGPATNALGTASGTNLTYGLIFSVTSPTTLAGVYVYPTSAGTANIQYQTSAATVIQSTTATFTAANVGVKTYVPLNFNLQVGTGFRLMLVSATGGASLSRNTAGAAYPYTSTSGAVSITGNTFTGYPQYYYYFYDWQIGSDCPSATRTPIQVNVTPAPTATLTATVTSTGGTLLTATPVAGATYEFFRNGTSVAAASTTNTLLITSPAQYGSYTVVVTSGGCASAPSNSISVTYTSTRPSTLNGVSLLVYPNPTPDGRLTLELTGPQAKASQLEVLNSLGQTVQRRPLAPGTATLSLAPLAAGVYTLRVHTEQGVLTQRVVRE
jgi:parallel beta-helix repeat protein